MDERIEYVDGAKCWVLTNDTGITPYVKKLETLGWDYKYNNLECWEHVKPGDLCVDVGAYIGDSCVIMLARGAEVVAIEGQADAAECLRRNFPNIEVHEVACGNGELVGLHGGAGGNMGARGIVPGDSLTTVRLDDIVGDRQVKVLKVDVEGYEAFVLRGAPKILAQRPIVVIERNDSALELYGSTWDEITALLPGYRFEVWQHTELRLWDYVAWPT
jgi:FkbM family methyltransferase